MKTYHVFYYIFDPKTGEQVCDTVSFKHAKGIAATHNATKIYQRETSQKNGYLYAIKKRCKWRLVNDGKPIAGIDYTMASIMNARAEQLMSESVPELEAQDKHARVVAILAEMFREESRGELVSGDDLYHWLLDSFLEDVREKVEKP